MSNAKQMVFESAEDKAIRQENEELQARIKANREKRKGASVSCKLVVTRGGEGPVGFTLNGMGVPKFFYKQQAMALLADTEEGKALRQGILAWIEANKATLTDKE